VLVFESVFDESEMDKECLLYMQVVGVRGACG